MELRLASVDVSKHSATLLLNMYSEEGRLCIEGRTEVINERVFTDDNYHTVSESNEVIKGKCIQLPPPTEDSVMVLSEVMGNRRSVRYFQSTAMDMQSLSNLLQTAGGLTKVSESGTSKKYFYTNPTASNHQEVEIFVFTAEAVFRYIPNGHSLTQILDCDCRRELGKMPFLKTAPVSLCLVSNLKKMVHHTDNYRRDMYSAMDIGYVSQNIYLHCAAHNMATVACGMIDRERIAELLGLTQEKVMLVHPIGIRKTISNE
jgi:SagB-type dehydrogenase family enzyme